MCCEPIAGDPDATVGTCKYCDSTVDIQGYCTEESCGYSPVACDYCHWKPCDQSC